MAASTSAPTRRPIATAPCLPSTAAPRHGNRRWGCCQEIAASWAEARGVHQVVCPPDRNAHGKAAPFRCNDELLNFLPKGVIAFPGSGITDNPVDKAKQFGIPVYSDTA